jgi:hypothetical protein
MVHSHLVGSMLYIRKKRDVDAPAFAHVAMFLMGFVETAPLRATSSPWMPSPMAATQVNLFLESADTDLFYVNIGGSVAPALHILDSCAGDAWLSDDALDAAFYRLDSLSDGKCVSFTAQLGSRPEPTLSQLAAAELILCPVNVSFVPIFS